MSRKFKTLFNLLSLSLTTLSFVAGLKIRGSAPHEGSTTPKATKSTGCSVSGASVKVILI